MVNIYKCMCCNKKIKIYDDKLNELTIEKCKYEKTRVPVLCKECEKNIYKNKYLSLVDGSRIGLVLDSTFKISYCKESVMILYYKKNELIPKMLTCLLEDIDEE